jgi:transcriptional regulator with XRE-family HTH domain
MFDVKKFRKQKGLTQNDFSKQLGYARTTIANIEAGNQPVNDNFLDKITQVFGINVEEFKSYNQKKPKESSATQDSGTDYLQIWQEKYIALLEEHNSLLLKFTRCLEEKSVLKDIVNNTATPPKDDLSK